MENYNSIVVIKTRKYSKDTIGVTMLNYSNLSLHWYNIAIARALASELLHKLSNKALISKKMLYAPFTSFL